jgi:hypothetical protein
LDTWRAGRDVECAAAFCSSRTTGGHARERARHVGTDPTIVMGARRSPAAPVIVVVVVVSSTECSRVIRRISRTATAGRLGVAQHIARDNVGDKARPPHLADEIRGCCRHRSRSKFLCCFFFLHSRHRCVVVFVIYERATGDGATSRALGQASSRHGATASGSASADGDSTCRGVARQRPSATRLSAQQAPAV